MKKALGFFAILVCAHAFKVFAIEWKMDSSPFSFPLVGVALAHPVVEKPAMFRSQQYTTGKVIMHYRLPAAAQGAKLSIYTMNGACKASFKVKSSVGSIEWSSGKTAMGVYVAILQSTMGEEKIKFSILQ